MVVGGFTALQLLAQKQVSVALMSASLGKKNYINSKHVNVFTSVTYCSISHLKPQNVQEVWASQTLVTQQVVLLANQTIPPIYFFNQPV